MPASSVTDSGSEAKLRVYDSLDIFAHCSSIQCRYRAVADTTYQLIGNGFDSALHADCWDRFMAIERWRKATVRNEKTGSEQWTRLHCKEWGRNYTLCHQQLCTERTDASDNGTIQRLIHSSSHVVAFLQVQSDCYLFIHRIYLIHISFGCVYVCVPCTSGRTDENYVLDPQRALHSAVV